MSRRCAPVAVFAQLFFLTLLGATCAFANGNSQPPLNRTGAPPQGQSCASCHTGNGNGSVSLSFPGGSVYQPGQNYTMTVTVADASKLRFGFSMVARDASNNTVDVGTWSAGSADTRPHGSGNSHISHTAAPSANGSHTFTVNWRAPAAGVGDITFYLAGVAANRDFNRGSGDNTYLRQVTISEPALPPNQIPVVTVPQGPFQVAPGAELAIQGISVSDPDAGGASIVARLNVENGQITIADSVPGGVMAGNIDGNGSVQVTFSGTLEQINTTFADPGGVIYQSDQGFDGVETVVVKANDQGNSGSGGPKQGEASFEVSVEEPEFEPVTLSDLAYLGPEGFQFTINGAPGQTVTINYTEDFKSWVLLEQRTLAAAEEKVNDPSAANSPRRFYRVE